MARAVGFNGSVCDTARADLRFAGPGEYVMGTVGHDAPAMFHAVQGEAQHRLREFRAQELASIAWAVAKSGNPAPGLFKAIEDEMMHRVHELDPQEMANLTWAFATACHPAPQLYAAIAEEGRSRHSCS